jgi:hypothetical protein
MDKETRDRLTTALQSGVETEMQSAWNEIYAGAMEALTYAENMLSELPDIDQLGRMIELFVGKSIQASLTEYAPDLTEDERSGFMTFIESSQ